MLFSVNTGSKTAAEISPVTLAQLQLRERYDLQEWVLHNPKLLGEELLVITSEYSGFDKTAERLDVLAIDRRGTPTIVELRDQQLVQRLSYRRSAMLLTARPCPSMISLS